MIKINLLGHIKNERVVFCLAISVDISSNSRVMSLKTYFVICIMIALKFPIHFNDGLLNIMILLSTSLLITRSKLYIYI